MPTKNFSDKQILIFIITFFVPNFIIEILNINYHQFLQYKLNNVLVSFNTNLMENLFMLIIYLKIDIYYYSMCSITVILFN